VSKLDKEKIRKAYKEILLREPDIEGFENYLNQIKNGEIAIHELPSIMRSSEEYKMISKNEK